MSGILAHYDTLGATGAAIERLRAAGHEDFDVFSPFPAPELEEAMGITSSPVRRWALIGGPSYKIYLATGNEENIKITSPLDLQIAEVLFDTRNN